ncbi:MAG: host-nuclease inhibitor Gam family protein [Ignavibacteriales bacterium]|nr:host-nuclease inhibitor Gam family protein [Ignavibacteriales bacterium]
MEDNKSFLDELLDEVESKETTLHLAHVDLILGEISNLEEQIAKNFEQTEKEIEILNEWTLRKNSKLQERIDWMTRKLEAFMKDQGENVKNY